jgi:hypothetical protein
MRAQSGLWHDRRMENDADVKAVLQQLREAVSAAGLDRLLHARARHVWRSNLDRREPELGDTARLLGMNCAENLTQLLHSALTEPATRIEGVTATLTQGALLIEVGGHRFRVIKAPAGSGLDPQWLRDFRWTPRRPLRYEMAETNARVYPAAAGYPGLEPLLSAEEVGLVRDARDLHDHFFVWAGIPGSPPRTAGWLATPTTAAPNFLAVEPLWLDSGDDADRAVPVAPQPSPDTEPELTLTLRQRPATGTA